MYVYSCISLIKVWPQKCLFLGFLTCLEWQYHNNNLAWWGFLLRKSSTFFSSLPSLSPPDIWLLSIARQEKCLFENRSIIIKNLVVECNECFACLYESRKKLQIGSFLERKIGGGGVRKEERVNSTKKCTSTIYTSQRSECNILKKTL